MEGTSASGARVRLSQHPSTIGSRETVGKPSHLVRLGTYVEILIRIILSGPRIRAETQVNNHITQMRLDIIEVRENDITSYRCVAKNSLGETDGKIRLYGERRN